VASPRELPVDGVLEAARLGPRHSRLFKRFLE